MSTSTSKAHRVVRQDMLFFTKDPTLGDMEYLTSCPPEVTPKTRLVFFSGVTDVRNMSHPENDGFFLSDLFLFFQLIKKSKAKVANMLFIIGCDPTELVKKYKRYTHGNPYIDRRVVLDESLLDDMTFENGWRICSSKDLLDTILRTIKGEREEALKLGQCLLLGIFAHGDPRSKGCWIGTKSNSSFDPENLPLLSYENLHPAVGDKVKCGIFSTSCFSGGWAAHPNLNYSVIAASGPDRQSHPYPISHSLTFTGSIMASVLLKTLFEAEETLVLNSTKQLNFEEVQGQESFSELGLMVYKNLLKRDRNPFRHQISFSAQDDTWDKQWNGRVGFPVGNFKTAWESLQQVRPQEDDARSINPASISTKRPPFAPLPWAKTGSLNVNPGIWTMIGTMPKKEIFRRVYTLAERYMESYPGEATAQSAWLHGRCDLVLSQAEPHPPLEELMKIWYNLMYRLEEMERATRYIRFAGLTFPDCSKFNADTWETIITESITWLTGDARNEAIRQRDAYPQINNMIQQVDLFVPLTGEIRRFYKPSIYLAMALAQSGRSMRQVEATIGSFQDCKYLIQLPPRI